MYFSVSKTIAFSAISNIYIRLTVTHVIWILYCIVLRVDLGGGYYGHTDPESATVFRKDP